MLLTKIRNIAAVVAIVLALAGAGIGRYGADAGEQPDDPKQAANNDAAARRLSRSTRTAELESEWVLEKAEIGGKPSPDIGWLKNELRWVIRGDSITVQRFGQSTMGTIKVDLKKAPREIDIHLVEGPVPGERVYRGIYKREDTRLTVCYAGSSEPRPTEFATKAGSSAMLVVFRRTERRGRGLAQGSRDLTDPPPLVEPKKKSPENEPPIVQVPGVMIVPETVYTPAVMPGGPVQLSPEYLKRLNEYKLTPSLLQQLQPLKLPATNPYTVPPALFKPLTPPAINPYTLPPALFKPPPWEQPNETPPAKKRVDASKDA
jgi:uncharacterized protein (TIGR03067 family)